MSILNITENVEIMDLEIKRDISQGGSSDISNNPEILDIGNNQ